MGGRPAVSTGRWAAGTFLDSLYTGHPASTDQKAALKKSHQECAEVAVDQEEHSMV